MKKTYVLDTNVLLSDPGFIHKFEDNDLIIPILVLEELDKHKNRSDEVGRNCREVSRILDSYSETGDLNAGVPLKNNGTLKIVSSTIDAKNILPAELTYNTSVDNMIIGFVMQLRSHVNNPILVSKDINVRVKCASLGIAAQDYKSMRVADNIETLYSGVKVITTSTEFIDEFYAGANPHISTCTSEETHPNQIIVIKSIDDDGNTIKSALSRLRPNGTLAQLRKFENIFGVKPRNKEQSFSIELLMDPEVKLVTLTGNSGCGKTYLTLAAALEQLETMGTKPNYQKLIVSRPVQPVGRDIGFLPGTLAEKMEPWLSPVRDNLEALMFSSSAKKMHTNRRKKSDDSSAGSFRDPYIDLMQMKGLIEMEAISYIRGRSIPNAFIIIDEAQNLTMHELKTIITRVGEGSKIVLTGDISQIDNTHVDTFTNGLTYAIEKFKEHSISGHITLLKGERSALATLASQIL